MMVLYCDALVLVYMELDFGELVCNQLVLSCREQNALDDVLDDGHGGVLDGEGGWVKEADSWEWSCSSFCGAHALEGESEGLGGKWTCRSSSRLPQDSSGESL